MDKKIEILLRECNKRDGGTFTTFKVVQKDGTCVDAGFTKAYEGPKVTESGYIMVPAGGISIDKRKKYPKYWIKEVTEYIPYSTREVDALDNF